MLRCEGLKLGDKKWVQECDEAGRVWGWRRDARIFAKEVFVIFGF